MLYVNSRLTDLILQFSIIGNTKLFESKSGPRPEEDWVWITRTQSPELNQVHILKMFSHISGIFLFQNKLILCFKLVFRAVCVKEAHDAASILTVELTVKCLWRKSSSFQVHFLFKDSVFSEELWIWSGIKFSDKMQELGLRKLQTYKSIRISHFKRSSLASVPLVHVCSRFVQREQNMWQSHAGNSLQFI